MKDYFGLKDLWVELTLIMFHHLKIRSRNVVNETRNNFNFNNLQERILV